MFGCEIDHHELHCPDPYTFRNVGSPQFQDISNHQGLGEEVSYQLSSKHKILTSLSATQYGHFDWFEVFVMTKYHVHVWMINAQKKWMVTYGQNIKTYSVFHRFREAKFGNGGSILSSSQFLLLP